MLVDSNTHVTMDSLVWSVPKQHMKPSRVLLGWHQLCTPGCQETWRQTGYRFDRNTDRLTGSVSLT